MPGLLVFRVKEIKTTPASDGWGKPRQRNVKSGRMQRFHGPGSSALEESGARRMSGPSVPGHQPC